MLGSKTRTGVLPRICMHTAMSCGPSGHPRSLCVRVRVSHLSKVKRMGAGVRNRGAGGEGIATELQASRERGNSDFYFISDPQPSVPPAHGFGEENLAVCYETLQAGCPLWPHRGLHSDAFRRQSDCTLAMLVAAAAGAAWAPCYLQSQCPPGTGSKALLHLCRLWTPPNTV